MDFIYGSSSWIFTSLLVVIPAILVSVFLLFWIRKHIHHSTLQKNHDVIGFTVGIVGVLYSVILGFTVVGAQDRYNETIQNIQSEALALADLYRDAGYFPAQNREAIRSSLQNYIEYVMKEEYRLPRQAVFNKKTQEVLESIWDSYYSVEVPNEKIGVWYNLSIEKLNKLLELRLTRTFNSWEHLNPMMWALLIMGAVITVGFLFFFGLENLRSQMFMIAVVVGYLSFILYLVYSLDNAFIGSEAVKPIALEQVHSLFEDWNKE